MKAHPFAMGFIAGAVVLLIANLVAVHLHSDGGLFEGLGLTHHVMDGIRRIGFPFQILEEGGYSYRHVFSPLALLLDVLVAVACACAAGFAFGRIQRRFLFGQV